MHKKHQKRWSPKMVCINGCCSQFFSLANLVPTSPPIHPVPHHPSTQHSDANHLTSPLRAHPPPAFLSWHQLRAQPRERTQGEHTFCTNLTTICPKKHQKSTGFSANHKSCSLSTALLRQHEQILHQPGAPFWRKTPDEHTCCTSQEPS